MSHETRIYRPNKLREARPLIRKKRKRMVSGNADCNCYAVPKSDSGNPEWGPRQFDWDLVP